MQKNTKTLLIIIVVIAALGLGGFFAYRAWISNKENLIGSPTKNEGTNGESSPVIMTTAAIEADPYLPQALAILNQINSHTDSRGFYGGWQDCRKNPQTNQYECKVQTMDYLNNGVQYASFRETQSVIWARYRYFERTGDLDQKRKLEADLDNVVNNVLDSEVWEMQSQRFNCLLMEAIANSPYLSETYKNKARRICNEVNFERYPDSVITYDQHHHVPFAFWDTSSLPADEVNAETVVVEDASINIPADQFITYQPETVITGITELIEDFAFANQLTDVSNVPTEDKQKFMKRELLAAIDRVAAIRLNEGVNQDLTAKNLLDYLLLTWETLSWYASEPQAFSSMETCLLRENVVYFLRAYAPDANPELKEIYKNKLLGNGSGTDRIYCEVASLYLGNKEINRAELVDFVTKNNQFYLVPDWTTGIVTFGLDFIFLIDPNALLAGILAK